MFGKRLKHKHQHQRQRSVVQSIKKRHLPARWLFVLAPWNPWNLAGLLWACTNTDPIACFLASFLFVRSQCFEQNQSNLWDGAFFLSWLVWVGGGPFFFRNNLFWTIFQNRPLAFNHTKWRPTSPPLDHWPNVDSDWGLENARRRAFELLTCPTPVKVLAAECHLISP